MQAISSSYLLLVPVEMGSSQCGRFEEPAEIRRRRGQSAQILFETLHTDFRKSETSRDIKIIFKYYFGSA